MIASGLAYLRLRLSGTSQIEPSHLQLPHGEFSTTSQRTLRARHWVQARAARRLVTLFSVPVRFFGDDDDDDDEVPDDDDVVGSAVCVMLGGDMERVGPVDCGEGLSPCSDIVAVCQRPACEACDGRISCDRGQCWRDRRRRQGLGSGNVVFGGLDSHELRDVRPVG